MRKKQFHLKGLLGLLLALTLSFLLGTPASAQSSTSQVNKPIQAQDNDTTRNQLTQFDQFMDSHREIAEQLRKDPSLVNNKEFVDKHPPLQTYLQDHPGVREEIRENPNSFMRQENRFDRRDSDTTVKELAQFDHFLDSHPETAEQLRKDPSLVNNKQFVDRHQALQTYLQDHPGVREEIRENPNSFMRQENRFDRHEDVRDTDAARRDDDDKTRRDNDSARRDTDDKTRRDNDSARRDTDDKTRRDNDSARRDTDDKTRRDNDSARRDTDDKTRRDNDSARRDTDDKTRHDNDFARRDTDDKTRRDNDFARRDEDTSRKQLGQFDRFADSHREIAEQLQKDPSLVNNKQFVEKHPALQAYMQDHPEMREEMKENPNSFMRQENHFDQHEDFRDSNSSQGHMASFGQFLGSHSSVAQQVSKDPSLVKNDDFVKSHPDLQAYLNAHPQVREEMKQNPQSFVKSAQQFNNNNSSGAANTPAPIGGDAKPKL